MRGVVSLLNTARVARVRTLCDMVLSFSADNIAEVEDTIADADAASALAGPTST